MGITFEDGYYYLIAWNDNHECMIEYRIDRMGKLRVADERATKNKQIAHHEYAGEEHEMFGRFVGDPMTATLLVDADKVEIILDRVGDTAEIFAKSRTWARPW